MSGDERPAPSGVTITIRAGAYKVSGGVTLVDDVSGETIAVDDGGDLFLCRCGQSSRKPFCDGTHKQVGFDGTLATRAPAEPETEPAPAPAPGPGPVSPSAASR